MSRRSYHHSDNEYSDRKNDLKAILNEIRMFKINTEVQFSMMGKEIKTLKEKEIKENAKKIANPIALKILNLGRNCMIITA